MASLARMLTVMLLLRYLEKGGQDATTGSLAPIQCYGNRGPIKKMDKPGIREVLKGEL